MHNADFFKILAAKEKNTRPKIRYLALHYFVLGRNKTQIAKYLGEVFNVIFGCSKCALNTGYTFKT